VEDTRYKAQGTRKVQELRFKEGPRFKTQERLKVEGSIDFKIKMSWLNSTNKY
jgi:hypothetical protein